MSSFLINTPSHKRWLLPDGVHAYNTVLYGDRFNVSVINLRTHEITDHHEIECLKDKDYKRKCFEHQTEMRCKYGGSSLDRYQQWEGLMLMARERKIDAGHNEFHTSYWIGKKRYNNVVTASCALLAAFKQVGTHVPPELANRPIDMD